MNHQLLALERAPNAVEPVAAIFRAVHTLKGMAATMGYQGVSSLAHELETLLDRIRRRVLPVTDVVMDLLFRGADALEAATRRAVAGEPEPDSSALLEAIQSMAGDGPAVMSTAEFRVPTQTEATAAGGRLVHVWLSEGSVLRGARAFLVIRRAEALGGVSAVAPSLEQLQADDAPRIFTFRLVASSSSAEIEMALRGVGDVERVEVEDRRAPIGADEITERGDETRAPSHVRIPLQRLDALMNLIGELVIARGRLQQVARGVALPALDETVAQASRLIGELQDEIMLSRMVPVAHVFDRFPRLVRDAARALEKQIEFTVEGQGIELDRSMLEEIGDPVLHLLRNAIDHGIERPADRLAAAKPARGRLSLAVVRERAAVTIEVRDDGRGIDRARVLQKAREMGLVTDATTRLADDDIVRLIARPGFSTADTVTDLSGRGVGIDVVVTRVRALGGSVEIRSIEGQGTTVTVRLPVTLAIVRALLARVDHEIYAVPMTHVRETLEVEAGALRRLQGRDVLLLRSDVVPVIQFRELVKLEPSPRGTTQVIVLALGERRAGLVVDELTGQQDIVVKQFDAVRDGVAVFSGATILADGAPALIVDVGSIL